MSQLLRLKLHSFLRNHGISETTLADAIADIVADSRTPVSERHLRYLTNNTELLTPENKDRKPSLIMLGYIIRGLRHLTGETVDVTDVVEYVTDPYETEWLLPTSPLIEGQNDAIDPMLDGDDLKGALVPAVSHSESYDLLDHIKDLTVHRLKMSGLYDLGILFAAAVGEESIPEATSGQRRWSNRKWRLILLFVLLLAAVTVPTYERLVVQPRLLAARGGIFSFRDRVKATSELPIPTLIGPEGEVDQLTPILRISDVPGALGYEFYVEDSVSGDNVYTGPVPNNSFLIPEGTLCPNTSYAWRVRVLGEDGWTSFSSPLEFTVSANALSEAQQDLVRLARITSAPETPTMVSPLGTATSTTPTLEVLSDPNAIGYGFYIRDLQTDQVIYNNNFALTNSVEVPENLLEEGGIYQWNARSRNCHFWSEFTPAQVFNVDIVGGS